VVDFQLEQRIAIVKGRKVQANSQIDGQVDVSLEQATDKSVTDENGDKLWHPQRKNQQLSD